MSIFLITLPNGSFGSSGQSWKKLDINKIKSLVDFNVEIDSIANIDHIPLNKDDVLIYTSSENPEVRQYIKNKLFYIKDKCTLIPSYDLLMAHEDKGFQEVMKLEKDFGNLKGNYFFDLDDHKISYPKVLKTAQGAGSSGVFLIKDSNNLKKIQNTYFNQSIKRKIIKLQRKAKLYKEEYINYNYKYKNFSLFVEQNFIPNLQHDFKVLVFGDRFFVLKRKVRKNDFRASGSGNFEFVEPPHEVLNFAKNISLILNSPYLSLDIAQSNEGCHLIEFQATNFGPYTLLNAPYRYINKGSNWLKENNCKDLEANYAYALSFYLGNRNV